MSADDKCKAFAILSTFHIVALSQNATKLSTLPFKLLVKIILTFSDIDTIEIRADEEAESGASKARRTYNYRVSELFF